MRLEVALGPNGEVALSDEQRAELGGGVRIPVAGTLNGTPFRTTAFRMHGFTGIAFRNDLQRAAGVKPGDAVVIELDRDTAARTVDVPTDLAAALAAAGLRDAFDRLSFTARREHVESVTGAKKPETRARRVAKVVESLTGGC